MKILMTLFTGIMLTGCAGADHQSMMVALGSSAVLRVSDSIRDGIRPVVPELTESQRIGNEIKTAFIFARAHFVSVQMLACDA